MAKFNIQQVSAFKPKNDTNYMRRSVQRIRMERFGQLDMPTEFGLDVSLIIDWRAQTCHCSRKSTKFVYSIERMRWENTDSVQWTSTVTCEAIAVGLFHPAYEDKELLRILLDPLNLQPGETLTIPPGQLVLDSQAGFAVTFPPEDYVIQEEPDAIDWQEQFVTALKYKPRKRKKR